MRRHFDPNNAGSSKAGSANKLGLQNIYEPGSTFKIVAFSAASRRDLAKPDDQIDCQMGRSLWRDVGPRSSPVRKSDDRRSARESSNVAAIKLGMRVGDPTMYDYITRFGFGARTGIELPGETAGLVRPVKSLAAVVDWFDRDWPGGRRDAGADGGCVWRLANDGVRVAPHLVREIRSVSGATVYRSSPEQRPRSQHGNSSSPARHARRCDFEWYG